MSVNQFLLTSQNILRNSNSIGRLRFLKSADILRRTANLAVSGSRSTSTSTPKDDENEISQANHLESVKSSVSQSANETSVDQSKLCIRNFVRSLDQVQLEWTTFTLGDMVILRHSTTGLRRMIGPLIPEGTFSNHKGTLNHSDLIGKRPRDQVISHTGQGFTLHFPTMEEYVLLGPRTATPIYPKDAIAIVNMLGIGPNHRILEAGTGSGALTLYLATAVANHNSGQILSIEMRPAHTLHAKKTIERYRRGLLKPYVHFATGILSECIGNHCDEGLPESCIDGVVLDMLNPWDQVSHVCRVMKPDGNLVVYAPSITQVVKTVEAIRKQRLPLALLKCVEFTDRVWDLRPVVIKWPEGREPIDGTEDVSSDSCVDGKDWLCRPSHKPMGHTGFLLHLLCIKKGSSGYE